MTRQLPVWLARGVLIVVVVAVVLAGHWLIPASIGLVPRIFALSLLVIVAAHKNDARPTRNPGRT